MVGEEPYFNLLQLYKSAAKRNKKCRREGQLLSEAKPKPSCCVLPTEGPQHPRWGKTGPGKCPWAGFSSTLVGRKMLDAPGLKY